METELNERQVLMLKELLFLNTPVDYEQLADKFNCSLKTVYRDLNKIRSINLMNFKIEYRKNEGIVLICDAKAYKELMNIVLGNEKSLVNYSIENRRNKIYLCLLLQSPNIFSIKELSEEYFVSMSSIVNDIKWIEKQFEGLKICIRKTREGSYLTGDEHAIRNEIARIQSQLHYTSYDNESDYMHRLNKETKMILVGIYGQKNVELVEKLVIQIEDSVGILLGDSYYVNIVTHILIATERMKNKKYLINEPNFSDTEKDSLIFGKIKDCMIVYANIVNVNFTDEEIRYIYIHFKACGVGELPNRKTIGEILEANNSNATNYCNDLIQKMENELGMKFTKDPNVYYSLLLHVSSMLTRIKYAVRIVNPIREQIITEYNKLYQSVLTQVIRLKPKYFQYGYLNDDEISYLTLYFYIGFKNSPYMKNILIVCSTGIGTSHLLEARVKKQFPDLSIKGIISLKQLKCYDFSKIDFVLTTVGIDFAVPVPYVYVSALLNQRDVEEISHITKGVES